LEKSKKLLAAVIVFMAAVFALYSQTTAATNDQSAATITEESIVFSDDASGDTGSSAQSYKGPSTVGMFVRMIVVLIIVVGLIYGVLWFIKKKTNVVKTDDEYLRRAAYINIAPGKSVEVITLIDKAYLIGVTEDNITLLGEIHDDELIKAMNLSADKKNNTKKPATFSDVLNMFLVKKGGQKNVFSEEENQVENIFTNRIENANNSGEE
jgi:flagellar protein FliO/FliZ